MALRPARTDIYAVVDDLVIDPEERVLVLALAPWPRLDEVGRFAWLESERSWGAHFLDPVAFQRKVDRARRRSLPRGSDLANRPLRVGDTFFIRGLAESGASWSVLIDVTAAARERAKIALYGAVAPRVTKTQLSKLHLEGTTESTAGSSQPRGVTPASPAL